MSATDSENEALAQSLGRPTGAPSTAIQSVEETQALAESLGGTTRAVIGARGVNAAAGLSAGEAQALAESLSGGASSEPDLANGNAAEGAAPLQTALADCRPRLSAPTATVASSVLRAVELSKGHKATATFMVQSYAAADPQLREALLAGNGSGRRKSVSEAAEKEVAAFLEAGPGPLD